MSFDDDAPTIWGNAKVLIEKDEEKRVWDVYSAGPEKQHLVTIPWAHALKEWPHAKDYGTAVNTCMASDLGLTEDELASLSEPPVAPAAPTPAAPEPAEPEVPSNVVLFPRRKGGQ